MFNNKKMTNEYTISAFTENKIGVLNRIIMTLTRRKVNIESLTVSESELKGLSRFTIVVKTTQHHIKNVVKQLERQVELFKAFYFKNDEIVHQEIALYKLKISSLTHSNSFEKIIRENNARVLSIQNDFIIIEKSGFKKDTQLLFNLLKDYGIVQFARSGRVALSKPEIDLNIKRN